MVDQNKFSLGSFLVPYRDAYRIRFFLFEGNLDPKEIVEKVKKTFPDIILESCTVLSFDLAGKNVKENFKSYIRKLHKAFLKRGVSSEPSALEDFLDLIFVLGYRDGSKQITKSTVLEVQKLLVEIKRLEELNESLLEMLKDNPNIPLLDGPKKSDDDDDFDLDDPPVDDPSNPNPPTDKSESDDSEELFDEDDDYLLDDDLDPDPDEDK